MLTYIDRFASGVVAIMNDDGDDDDERNSILTQNRKPLKTRRRTRHLARSLALA